MKKLILLFTMLLACSVCVIFAQSEEREQSKSATVELLNKDGVLLKKEYYDIGKVGGVEFQNIIITNATTGDKTGALRIETTYYSSSTGTDYYIGTLDYDELEDCIKSLLYIKENIITSIPETYTECQFRTKDDVSFTVFLSEAKKEKVWSISIRTKSYTNRSQEFLKINEFDLILENLKKAQSNLMEKL